MNEPTPEYISFKEEDGTAPVLTFPRDPALSEWQCHLFGSTIGHSITWRPIKGQEPNAFWRWMQYLCFGNRWVKRP